MLAFKSLVIAVLYQVWWCCWLSVFLWKWHHPNSPVCFSLIFQLSFSQHSLCGVTSQMPHLIIMSHHLKKKQAAIKVKLIGADACLFSAVLEAKKKKIWMLLLPPGRMAKCSQSFPSGLFWNANVVSSLRWMFAVGFEVWLICLCKPLAWVEH